MRALSFFHAYVQHKPLREHVQRHQPEHRLLRRPEFIACYDQGRRYHSRRFVVFVLARKDQTLPSRCGTGVGKKTGNAVRRNRVKRLVREFFRRYRKAFGPGLDVVIVPKRGIDVSALGQQEVDSELLPLLLRAAKDAHNAAPT